MKTILTFLLFFVALGIHAQNLIPFSVLAKTGEKNEMGEPIAENKWGYKNESGKVIIEPEYSCAFRFHDDLALVEKDDKYGVINSKHEIIVPISRNGVVGINELINNELKTWYIKEYRVREFEAFTSNYDNTLNESFSFSSGPYIIGGHSCDRLFDEMSVVTIHGYLQRNDIQDPRTLPVVGKIHDKEYAVVTNKENKNGIILFTQLFDSTNSKPTVEIIYNFKNVEILFSIDHPGNFITYDGNNYGLLRINENHKIDVVLETKYFGIQTFSNANGSFFRATDIKYTYKNNESGAEKVFNYNEIPKEGSGWTFVNRDLIETDYNLKGNKINTNNNPND